MAGFSAVMVPDGLALTIDAHENKTPETILDLVFVIDNSGSMKKNDPKFITPKVVSTFVRQLPKSSQVGIVLFDQKAHLLIPLTLVGDAQAQQGVIDSLKNIDYRGQHTNTPSGIERALYELKTNGRNEAKKGIVFVTDGIVDTGNKQRDLELTQWLKEDITSQSKQMGIRIFAIAFTESADFSLIQALATRTGGEYFRAFEAGEISGVLHQIQTSMTPKIPDLMPDQEPLPVVPVPTEKLQPKPEEKARTAEVPPQQDRPMDQGTVVVTEKDAWGKSIIIALVIITLIAVVIFFLFQNASRKDDAPLQSQKTLNIPEAWLEDLDQVLGEASQPLALDRERINVGRSKRNDMIIDEPAISGFHATIEFRNMCFYLEDQRSTNGTTLNDRRLGANDPVRLKSGDSIAFARYRFKFVIADQKPFGDTVMLSMTALEDPVAETTIVLDLGGADSKQGLISCLQKHLVHIEGLSPNHKTYVNTYFSSKMLDIIASSAHENLQKTTTDGEQHCTPIINSKALYAICSLPGSIDSAAQWFGARHNGFAQFIFQWIRSDQYVSAGCDQLCIVTFGQDPATWVSITIVPTHSEPDPVEIMSVDFLNDEEKASLGLDFDNHGRIV
jgi:pSer/pThr/pTyr-binding forkhead associated (FHA) protein/Mg-chelatase subunit ChlD